MLFLLQKCQYLLTLFGADDFDAKEKPSKIFPIYLTSVSDPTNDHRVGQYLKRVCLTKSIFS